MHRGVEESLLGTGNSDSNFLSVSAMLRKVWFLIVEHSCTMRSEVCGDFHIDYLK